MREPQNIAELARLKPDYMGFIFYERSPRFAGELDPTALQALPPEVLRVGVFVNAPQGYIHELAERYSLNMLQLHGDETPNECAKLQHSYKVIKAFGIASKQDIDVTAAYEGCCDYFLFDTKTILRGGSGKKFDHSLLDAYRGKTPFFLSGGIGLQDTEAVKYFSHPKLEALDINSCFEVSFGVKDAVRVKEFIEKIKK